jgi:hypothetical protein
MRVFALRRGVDVGRAAGTLAPLGALTSASGVGVGVGLGLGIVTDAEAAEIPEPAASETNEAVAASRTKRRIETLCPVRRMPISSVRSDGSYARCPALGLTVSLY